MLMASPCTRCGYREAGLTRGNWATSFRIGLKVSWTYPAMTALWTAMTTFTVCDPTLKSSGNGLDIRALRPLRVKC